MDADQDLAGGRRGNGRSWTSSTSGPPNLVMTAARIVFGIIRCVIRRSLATEESTFSCLKPATPSAR